MPSAGLTSVNGMLYGTTANGGDPRACPEDQVGCGTIFSVDIRGREKVLYRFKGGTDGIGPVSQLTYLNGTFYGTTASGGTPGCAFCGTVFSVSETGQEHVLYRFPGGKGGGVPTGGVIAVHGMLYGATQLGGQANFCLNECGTIFSIVPQTGAERVLHYFTGNRDGFLPVGPLISIDNMLFGTTQSGGEGWPEGLGCCGTVYAVSTTGSERVVYRFELAGTDKEVGDPVGGLIGVRGVLYGTTSYGTSNNTTCPCGTVFSTTQAGVERTLFQFNGATGNSPHGSLVWDGKNFYGTTVAGGLTACTNGCGILFSLTPTGEEQILHQFQGGQDGFAPGPDLLLLNGTLYGVTEQGGGKGCRRAGYDGCGTIFAMKVSE
jgi:uncharacterized repeat protein (TIGR03803 family)